MFLGFRVSGFWAFRSEGLRFKAQAIMEPPITFVRRAKLSIVEIFDSPCNAWFARCELNRHDAGIVTQRVLGTKSLS